MPTAYCLLPTNYNISDAVDTYMSYIGSTGSPPITPEMVVQSVTQPLTTTAFTDMIFMRVFKRGIENKDDRSIFEDFREFEEKYAGKKSTKNFKTIWATFIESRECAIKLVGIDKDDEKDVLDPLGTCIEKEVEVEVEVEVQMETDSKEILQGISKKKKKNKGKKNNRS